MSLSAQSILIGFLSKFHYNARTCFLFALHFMVTCIIKNSSGDILGKFTPPGENNLLDEAADAGIELPFSCHAGACMSCAARILKGAEFFDQEAHGMKYIDTDDDVCLTCIGGIKQEALTDDQEHVVELEILMD